MRNTVYGILKELIYLFLYFNLSSVLSLSLPPSLSPSPSLSLPRICMCICMHDCYFLPFPKALYRLLRLKITVQLS